jgi:hypothetical protein
MWLAPFMLGASPNQAVEDLLLRRRRTWMVHMAEKLEEKNA